MAFEKSSLMVLAIVTIIFSQGHALKVGHYNGKCNGQDVEKIVFDVVKEQFNDTLTPALLRMQFHDCFVRGCDASLLLKGPGTESTAGPNGSVRGYELIDAIKDKLESICKGVVSCADIIAIATRDAVKLVSDHSYDVETGRLDGVVSIASEANSDLPPTSISVSKAIAEFRKRNLNAEEFVILLAAHTVGITHCGFVRSSPKNPALVATLAKTCPDQNSASNPIFLDQTPGSGNVLDDGFCRAIEQNMGVLDIDQRIAFDPQTKRFVNGLTKENFLFKFGQAMIKLGRVPMPVGEKGEIRDSCSAINGGLSGGLLP